MMIGLVGSALVLPLLSLATDFRSAAFAMVPMWMVFSMIVTPSLAYMAEAASAAGFESYGVVYGVYNMAWAVGLMVAPALGGFLLERIGFEALTVGWGLLLLVIGLILARIGRLRATLPSRRKLESKICLHLQSCISLHHCYASADSRYAHSYRSAFAYLPIRPIGNLTPQWAQTVGPTPRRT